MCTKKNSRAKSHCKNQCELVKWYESLRSHLLWAEAIDGFCLFCGSSCSGVCVCKYNEDEASRNCVNGLSLVYFLSSSSSARL